MKKLLILVAGLLIGQFAVGQAVKDRAVVPVAVNLNQVLRVTITNGGNIEFTFNQINQYKNGINSGGTGAADYYDTYFTVSSSTRWELWYGAEDATFIGVDNAANTLALDNVGWAIESTGTHQFATELSSTLFVGGSVPGLADVNPLQVYPQSLINDNGNALASAGDGGDNAFHMVWRCGTVEGSGNALGTMANVAIIDQTPSPTPDRYVTNVLFELQSTP